MTILRWGALAACIALFVHALATADLAAAWARIRAIGPLALLVLVPLPIGLLCDAAALARLLAALGKRVRIATLFRIRLATEAVVNSAPAGSVFADALQPLLIGRRTDASIADAFAASTARRWIVVRTHGAYVAVTVALGVTMIARASTALLGGRHGLPLLVLTGALGLVLLANGIQWLATRGSVAERMSGLVGRARFLKLGAWIEKRRHHFERADEQLARLGEDKRADASAMLRIAGLWLMEGVETWLILNLLGAQIDLVDVISFDAALSVVRSAAVFAPAGIGVQDVGYMAVLSAYGVPDAHAIGPAFVVLKRAKEAFWMVVGFVILARSGVRPKAVREAQLAQADSAAT